MTSDSATLTWTNPDDADYAGVVIRRAVGSTPPGSPDAGELVADLAAPAATLTDTGLAADTTYSYALFAYDEVPNLAAAATTSATTPGSPDTVSPGPVTGLSVDAVTSDSVTLTWTNPEDADYAGVVIRRAVGSTPPGSPDAGELVADLAAPADTLTDTGLAADTTYSYALFAHDEVPNFAAAATTSATTPGVPDPPDTVAPGPVTGLSVDAVTSDSVTLTWTNPEDADYAGVVIRRAVGSTPPGSPDAGELVADLAAPADTLTDTGLAADTTYSYALFAHDEVPNFAAAATTSATTPGVPDPPDTVAPGPVTGLSVDAVTSDSVTLTWTNPEDADYAGVVIRRAVGSTPPGSPDAGELVADLAAPADTLTDTGLAADTTYSYALFAHDEVPNFAAAATTSATTPGVPDPPDTVAPGPVTGLSVDAVTSDSVTLTWTNPEDADYAGVVIRRAVGSTPPGSPDAGELVADLAAPADTLTDTGLAADTTYSYALFAHDEVPNFAAAATTSATTPGVPDTVAPGPVTGLSVDAVTSDSVTLTWTNPEDADYAGVVIRRAVGSTPPGSPDAGELVADLAAPADTLTDTGLAADTTYSYALFAHDEVPNFAAAATTSATTASSPLPSGLPFVSGVSANGRYFVDQAGKPILVRGDSPWAILLNASPAQMDLYVSTRAAQGFNAVLLSLLGSVANGGPSNSGATYDGLLPFVGGDPSRLNDAYWDRVEHFLTLCRLAGITVMAYPIDGWVGTAESGGLAGDWSNDTAQAYGRAVAARLSGYPNVIWAVGGDYPVAQPVSDARFAAVLAGLAPAGWTGRPRSSSP